MKQECENCAGQGIDPNDEGCGEMLCEICGGDCIIEVED